MSMSVRNRMLGLRPTEEVTTPVTEIDPDIALELQRNEPVLPAVAEVVEPAVPAVAPAAIVEVPERAEFELMSTNSNFDLSRIKSRSCVPDIHCRSRTNIPYLFTSVRRLSLVKMRC